MHDIGSGLKNVNSNSLSSGKGDGNHKQKKNKNFILKSELFTSFDDDKNIKSQQDITPNSPAF